MAPPVPAWTQHGDQSEFAQLCHACTCLARAVLTTQGPRSSLHASAPPPAAAIGGEVYSPKPDGTSLARDRKFKEKSLKNGVALSLVLLAATNAPNCHCCGGGTVSARNAVLLQRATSLTTWQPFQPAVTAAAAAEAAPPHASEKVLSRIRRLRVVQTQVRAVTHATRCDICAASIAPCCA
jgi:hypothetical protein